MKGMTLRVLELAEQLKVGTDDLLAVCTLLEIPATSRISCLSPKHILKAEDLLPRGTGEEIGIKADCIFVTVDTKSFH